MFRLAISILLLNITFCFGQSKKVKGLVLDEDTKSPVIGAEIFIVKNNSRKDTSKADFFIYKFTLASGQVIASADSTKILFERTLTDSMGSFIVNHFDSSIFSIIIVFTFKRNDVEYFSYGYLSDRLGSPVYYIKASCFYDKTKDLEACPRCKQKDKVQPILWGLPVLDLNGNSIHGDLNKYYLGGCEVHSWCNASKHCTRCELNF
jgi:hypothetical protein